MAVPSKYQAKEVLNKVLNSGEDALNVDLADSVTVTVDSEFPAAEAITDAFANPITTSSMSMLMGWNSATWDRVIVKTATSDSDPDLDGLNLLGTHALLSARKDASTTVGLTAADGTHNALHVAITDGSNALVMQAAAGETEDEDTNAITSVSTVYGFDSEGSSNSKLRALQVAVDNAGLSTTPNVLVTGGIYKSALDTYADNDASPLHFDANGRLIIGGSTAHDAAVAGNPLLAGYEAKTLDGSALPNTVNAEGDIVRAASTLSGVAYNNLVVVDGSESAISEHDVAIGSGLGTAGVVNLYESKNQDASAFPNAVNAEGDMIRPAASLSGVQYIMPVSEDGSKTPMATDDSGQVATPEMLNVGGEYRSSVTTYTNGDATILQSDVNGRLLVGGSAAEDAAIAGNPIPAGGRYDSSVRTLDNGDVGTLALDPTGALYTREYLGQAGSILVTGTTNAVTTSVANTKFIAIQFLEDTTFDAGAEGLVASTAGLWPDDANASTTIDSNGGAVTGSEVFPQGMTIFGRWDGFKLDSGKVIGYLGYV